MSSYLRFDVGEDDYDFTSYVYDQKHNKQEVGRFQISKLLPDTPHSMSMSINVDKDYQGNGISMTLISKLVNYIITNKKLSKIHIFI